MERGSPCVTLSLIIRILQSDADRWTMRCASFQYQFSTNLDPDRQWCLTVQSIVRREISLNPFMASIRVRPSVSSTASSSFTIGYRKVSCFVSPSAQPLRCICRSYSSPVSDASASSPPSLSSGTVASALPCCILSLLRSRSSLRRVFSADSRRSLRSVPVSSLMSSSCFLTACMAPSLPAFSPAQIFTL